MQKARNKALVRQNRVWQAPIPTLRVQEMHWNDIWRIIIFGHWESAGSDKWDWWKRKQNCRAFYTFRSPNPYRWRLCLLYEQGYGGVKLIVQKVVNKALVWQKEHKHFSIPTSMVQDIHRREIWRGTSFGQRVSAGQVTKLAKEKRYCRTLLYFSCPNLTMMTLDSLHEHW
jgi:hypothetical protein